MLVTYYGLENCEVETNISGSGEDFFVLYTPLNQKIDDFFLIEHNLEHCDSSDRYFKILEAYEVSMFVYEDFVEPNSSVDNSVSSEHTFGLNLSKILCWVALFFSVFGCFFVSFSISVVLVCWLAGLICIIVARFHNMCDKFVENFFNFYILLAFVIFVMFCLFYLTRSWYSCVNDFMSCSWGC